MTARLLKESRLMLPLLLIGVVVLLACLGLERGATRLFFATILFCLLCAVVGVGAVGFEMTNGMHLHLLTQPVPRELFWRDKLLIQGTALAILSGIYGWVTEDPHVTLFGMTQREGFLVVSAVAPLAAIGFGSALVLTIKHVQGSFWLLVASTLGSQFVVWALWPDVLWMVVAFASLVFVGCWFSRERFVAFQRFSALDRAVSWGDDSVKASSATTKAAWLRTLLIKEFRLQSVNLLVFGVALTVILVLGIFHPDMSQVITRVICLLLPCCTGAVSLCGERGSTVHRWHLALPVSARRQWMVKMMVSMGLGVGLGAAIFIGIRWNSLEEGELFYLCAAPVVCVLGILVSSFTRGFAVSIGMSLLLIIGLAFFSVQVSDGYIIGGYGYASPMGLFMLFNCLVLFLPCLWLSYRNFRSIESSWVMLRRTIAVLAGGLTASLLLTAVPYHRSWELVNQPELGPTIPEGEKLVLPFMSLSRGVTLDNQGRLWRMDVQAWLKRKGPPEVPRLTQIGTDSDWVKLIHTRDRWFGKGALKEDGSFWTFAGITMGRTNDVLDGQRYLLDPTEATPGVRWKDVAHVVDHWQGVREDGTLWTWGAKGEMRQVGRDNDWVEVIGTKDPPNYVIKNDNSLWVWGTVRAPNRPLPKEHITNPRPSEAVEELVTDWRNARRYGVILGILKERNRVGKADENSITPEVRRWLLENSIGEEIIPFKNGELFQQDLWMRSWFGRRVVNVPGNHWLAGARIGAHECLGLKTNGSVWYWNDLNEMNYEHVREHEGKMMVAAHDRLIPYRFRPVKIGMLDRKVWQ